MVYTCPLTWPYGWLAYVLKRLPLAKSADAYEQLLPWNITPQDLITHTAP